jgi:hypothetical protein
MAKRLSKKGLSELSLCAKQLPGLRGASGGSGFPAPSLSLSLSLAPSLARSLFLLLSTYVSPIAIADTEHWGIDAARKCRSSFSPVVSESRNRAASALIWNLGFQICHSAEDRFLLLRLYVNLGS